MNRLLITSFCIWVFVLNTENTLGQDVQSYFSAAKEAREKKDYEGFYNNILEANKLHPYHQVILYQKGIACALIGKRDEAIKTLKEAILIDSKFDLSIEELKKLKGTKEFNKLLSLQQQLRKEQIKSDTAFVIPAQDAHIESVAYDPVDNDFYLGSINKRKIIKRDANGTISDFIQSGEHGIAAVFGVRVDAAKRILWACASPIPEMENYDSTVQSAVYKFDLTNGSLLATYPTETPAVLGDLTLNSEGLIYTSDGRSNKLYVVNELTGKLDIFYETDEFWNIQGIAFSNDNKIIYIADYIKGPFFLEVNGKKLHKMDAPTEQSLKGIDGFLFYNNSLIALQNGVYPLRVMQYVLNKERTAITQSKIIDWAHPAFGEPTIGCISKQTLYYVANSQWGAYNELHQFDSNKATGTVILKHTFRP